jgi:hypothetical protein
MSSFGAIIAISALLATVSGSPLQVRSTCGSTPSASGSQTPLQQPTGITTAAACQAQCDANASCQSFVFGMVDNVDQCILYSVAAASIPKQSSTNLVVYDKACTSVPTVVPTSSNPTGANTGSTSSTSGSGTGSTTGGNTGSNTGSTGSTTGGSTTGNQNQNGPARLAVRDTCGSAPAGPSGNANPISTPTNINSAADCKAQCQADASCKSFEYGTLTQGGSPSCRLFNVAASAVPAPTNGQSVVVYDVGCSV